jgi:hypothetical protein
MKSAPILNAKLPEVRNENYDCVIMSQLPLKSLHDDSYLIRTKLDQYRKLSTQELIDSLKPGETGALKVKPDGTMMDGHHRIRVLQERGVDVDLLPREIIPADQP